MYKQVSFLALLGVLLAIYFNDIITSLFGLQRFGSKSLFTVDELSTFDGVQHPYLYLAILGNIFNVTKGHKHYGVGQSYHFFVGKDASKSFITGKYDKEEATDDLTSLTHQELKSLNHWLKFYKKEYKKIGKLIGRYYDDIGRLTPYARQIKKLIREAEEAEKSDELEKLKFPPCNIEWDAEKGSRVWCTKRSGGIERSWVGTPRQLYEPGSKSFRCACIIKENENVGTIKEYEGCDSNSDSCYIKV